MPGSCLCTWGLSLNGNSTGPHMMVQIIMIIRVPSRTSSILGTVFMPTPTWSHTCRVLVEHVGVAFGLMQFQPRSVSSTADSRLRVLGKLAAECQELGIFKRRNVKAPTKPCALREGLLPRQMRASRRKEAVVFLAAKARVSRIERLPHRPSLSLVVVAPGNDGSRWNASSKMMSLLVSFMTATSQLLNRHYFDIPTPTLEVLCPVQPSWTLSFKAFSSRSGHQMSTDPGLSKPEARWIQSWVAASLAGFSKGAIVHFMDSRST